MRYEDILGDPCRELLRILAFTGVHADEARVRDAVDVGAFDNMQKLEQGRQGDVQLARESLIVGSEALRPGDPSDKESFKVRRGEHGGYTAYLDDDDITYLNRLIAVQSRIAGHPLNYSVVSSQFSEGRHED